MTSLVGEALLWRALDYGFDLLALGMKREEIVGLAKARQEAGATPAEIVTFLRDLRKQKAAEARQAVVDSPDD